MQPRGLVTPRVALSAPAPLEMPADAPEQSRRIALAARIADPSNPPTAEVMVNRLRQHDFGEGIAATPSDFGVNGAPGQPTPARLAGRQVHRPRLERQGRPETNRDVGNLPTLEPPRV